MRKWLAERKDYWQPSSKEFRAFVVSIIFLILGFFTILTFRGLLKLQQDAVLVAILLVPVLIYLILSGKLLEINAGGVSAKFNDVAQKPLFDKDGINIPLEIEPVLLDEKRDLAELPYMLRDISEAQKDKAESDKSLVLTVMLGLNNYNNKALVYYLQGLSRFRKFSFLVILHEDEGVFGYIEAWRALQILQLEMEMEEEIPFHKENFKAIFKHGFAQAINESRTKELTDYGIIKASVKPTDKTLDVLETMTKLNMDALIVTDENCKLQGVVKREQVLSKLILAIAK